MFDDPRYLSDRHGAPGVRISRDEALNGRVVTPGATHQLLAVLPLGEIARDRLVVEHIVENEAQAPTAGNGLHLARDRAVGRREDTTWRQENLAGHSLSAQAQGFGHR